MTIFETISLYTFFVLQPMLDAFIYWKLQMITLVGEQLRDDELPLWGMPVPESVTEVCSKEMDLPLYIYEESSINVDHTQFFESLLESVSDCTDPVIPFTYEDTEQDFLNVYNMEEPVSAPDLEEEVATQRISDYVMGQQIWTAEVVGEEQGYLHVSDGTGRAWVNGNRFGQFFRGDILSLLVEREADNVYALQIELLQRKSADFIIYDEEEVIFEQMMAATA